MADISRILDRAHFHFNGMKPWIIKAGVILAVLIFALLFSYADIFTQAAIKKHNPGGLFYIFQRASFDPSDAEGFYCTVKIGLTILIIIVIIRLRPILQDIIRRLQ